MVQVMKGVRVLEVAEHTFVPAASAVLADWGADVIKVEHAERGDAMRGLGRTGVLDLSQGVHVLNEHSNRGKRSIGIDISNDAGREILFELAKKADVFLTNKLPGTLEKLRIDVDAVRAHNPNIIYVRGTAFGPRGPDADRGGYDMTGYWCRAGTAGALTHEEIGVAPQAGPAYGDSLGGMTIAGGIAAALFQRERTGEAAVVDVSLLGTGMWAMASAIALSLQMGVPWTAYAMQTGGGNPLTGTYRTRDGRFICFVMLQAFHYWPDFCAHISRDDLVTDPRFDSHENLTANAVVARQIIGEEIAKQDLADWVARFQTMTGQWTPVQDTLQVAADPQARANGYMQSAETQAGTSFELVASPVQFDEQDTKTRRAPEFNEHGDEILQEVGLEMDRILELKACGAVA
ncbi:MAG: carnitine dehydratase [Deltaproteobacteria bacterium]|nr:carnitine dehydratase [Deltaproteobacteria bacterium]